MNMISKKLLLQSSFVALLSIFSLVAVAQSQAPSNQNGAKQVASAGYIRDDVRGTGAADWLRCATNENKNKATQLIARREFSATQMPDGRVFIWGGLDEQGSYIKTGEWLEQKQCTTSKFEPVDLLPRQGHTAIVLTDGRLLMIGGSVAEVGELSRAEVWDWRRNQSVLLTHHFDSPLKNPQATLLADGRVELSIDQQSAPIRFLPEASNDSFNSNQLKLNPASASLEDSNLSAEEMSIAGSAPFLNQKEVKLDALIGLRFANLLSLDPNAIQISLIGPRGQEKFARHLVEAGRLLFVVPSQELLPDSEYTVLLQVSDQSTSNTTRSNQIQSVQFRTEKIVARNSDERIQFTTEEDRANFNGGSESKFPAAQKPPSARLNFVGNEAELYRQQQVAAYFSFDAKVETDPEVWIPTKENLGGKWRTGRPYTDAIRQAYALGMSDNAKTKGWRNKQLKQNTTSVSGFIFSIADRPLDNVSIQIGNQRATTNKSGFYQIDGLSAGHHTMMVDGQSVPTSKGDSFAQFEISVNAISGKETPQNPIFLPKIRAQDWIEISSPLEQDSVIRHPSMPGFEVHLPKGTVLRDREGKIVRKVATIPMPLDRTPINYPVDAPLHMSFQPAGLQIEGLTPTRTRGIRFIYPNYSGAKAGTEAGFLNYDPIEKGWHVYGSGKVSDDGLRVIPNAGTEIYKASGFGFIWNGYWGPAHPDSTPQNGGCQGADPVDLRTGLFLHYTKGPMVSDRLSASFNTSYRPLDPTARDIGKGTFHSFSHYLSNPGNGGVNWSVINLVLPDCSLVKFYQTSPAHPKYPQPDYLAVASNTISAFFGATLKYDMVHNYFEITRRDGMRYQFLRNGTGLYRIIDKHNNSVEISRIGGALSRITTTSGKALEFTPYAATAMVGTAKDMLNRTWTYSYDGGSRLTQITYPDASNEHYTIDASGRMTEVWNRRNQRMVLNVYDANNRIAHQTLADGSTYQLSYLTDVPTGLVSEVTITEPGNHQRRVRFHASGYPSEITTALNTPQARTTTYTRDSIGNLVELLDPLNRKLRLTYDAQKRVTSATILADTAQALTTSYAYNTHHDVVSMTDPQNRTTTITYDNRRRVTKVTDYRNREVNYTWDTNDRVIQITDPQNRAIQLAWDLFDLVQITDAQGKISKRFVDNLGRVLSTQDANGNRSAMTYDSNDRVTQHRDSKGQLTQTNYDAMGNVLQVIDAKNNATSWTYDAMQRPLTKTDASGKIESWNYDVPNRRVTHTDRALRTSIADHDVLGRLTTLTLSDSTITMQYDLADRLQQISDASGAIQMSYDHLDQLINETTPSGSISYQYDLFGKPTQTTPQSGGAISYLYDQFDRLTNINQNAESVAFQYDNFDKQTKLILPNQTEQRYSYNTLDQLTKIDYWQSGASVGEINYGFDAAGRLINRTSTFADTQLPNANTSDSTFNLTNQQTGIDGRTIEYDNVGNLKREQRTTAQGGGWRNYSYDARDRLISVDDNGTVIASYAYDVFNRRTSKTINGTATTFKYDGDNVIEETTGGNTYRTLNGFGMDERYARDDIGGRNYFLTDLLGSTIGLQNNLGAWKTKYAYTPYGETAIDHLGGAAQNNPFQHTGRENDGNGLYYYRARYFNPTMGRFTQEDPLGLGGGDVNLFAYVGGAPTMYTDPTGEIAFLPVIGWMAVGWAADYAWDRWGAEPARRFGESMLGCDGMANLDVALRIVDIARSIKNPTRWARSPKRVPGTHDHHSYPKFLGGDPKQPLTGMSEADHKALHKDLNDYLRKKVNADGKHMRPQRGNSGPDIRRNFSPEKCEAALCDFYSGPGSIYINAAADFFKQIGGSK